MPVHRARRPELRVSPFQVLGSDPPGSGLGFRGLGCRVHLKTVQADPSCAGPVVYIHIFDDASPCFDVSGFVVRGSWFVVRGVGVRVHRRCVLNLHRSGSGFRDGGFGSRAPHFPEVCDTNTKEPKRPRDSTRLTLNGQRSTFTRSTFTRSTVKGQRSVSTPHPLNLRHF
jgi:hypothetical protein